VRPLVLDVGASHLYPGCRIRVDGAAWLPRTIAEKPCLVVFADGSTAAGMLRRRPAGLELVVAGYRTARGTAIAPKRWTLVQGTGSNLRVQGRLPP
jgi:hypothetical protein